ncbi:MAG: ASCH domain-containing protein [Pyrinomonadaceae bacterium]
MNSEVLERFWADFCRTSGVDVGTPYQSWFFGNSREMALELAELVIAGTKTATASLEKTNELIPENAPIDNGYSVVTDFDGEPRCVIRTAEIRHIPFREVDAEFAADEGEGDLSLEYWRRVHRDYFEKESAQLGFEFDENSMVCCERFTLQVGTALKADE